MPVNELRRYLTAHGVSDDQEVLRLLGRAWDDLGTSATYQRERIYRAEQLSWDDPILAFKVERHGAIVGGGSRRAELYF